jgi:hypothetical protein
MSKIVRMTSDEPLSAESIEQLKRLAEMPDDQIRTDLIPERHFDLELAAKRRKEGWTPGKAGLKKAS